MWFTMQGANPCLLPSQTIYTRLLALCKVFQSASVNGRYWCVRFYILFFIMWYTTSFTWQFNLDKPLTVPQFNELKNLEDKDLSYCKREPTEDWMWIERDWGEKFYDYVERMDKIIILLKSRGINCTWEVVYNWEEYDDQWIMKIVDGKCVQIPAVFSWETVTCPHCEKEFQLP
jgi:hypothetical protein